MTDLIQPDRGQSARAIHLVGKDGYEGWLAAQPARVRAALAAHRFRAKAFATAILPGDGPEDWTALGIVADPAALSPWCLSRLAEVLPEGTYRLAEGEAGPALFGWIAAQYRFGRYKADEQATGPRVLLTRDVPAIAAAVREADATRLVRDLVNTPASDLGPAELEGAAEALAEKHGATLTVTRGTALQKDFPLVHWVGVAADRGREPRMIELEWGRADAPRVAIIGKGVCFDTGGLDIKPGAAMRLMKKDMGGAAHALALAGLVMDARLPVRLHLLVPAVENAIAAAAARPGDIARSRKGLTVENTNTDAEGRLILADALTRAAEGEPVLAIDFATLTGAARVALGPDLPAMFANDEALAADLLAAGTAVADPLWRLPLWDGYDEMLSSDIADLQNSPEGGMAGASVAALFLRRFVPADLPWAHFDTFAWRPGAKPGRPKGGDALGLRAAWTVLQQRFGG